MRVPALLLDAMSNEAWPKGRVVGSLLAHVHPLFRELDFELLQDEKQLERNGIADTNTLVKFASNPQIREKFGLEIDVTNSVLPKLDVNQALVFGGGADFGDDFWLTLDLRTEFAIRGLSATISIINPANGSRFLQRFHSFVHS